MSELWTEFPNLGHATLLFPYSNKHGFSNFKIFLVENKVKETIFQQFILFLNLTTSICQEDNCIKL